ncbi:MAG: endonuclease/exonuclease/phosphatase family protein [Verrucomicrobiales bacterium]
MTIMYCLFLAGLWAAFRWKGEENLTLAFLLFAPPQMWALPFLVLLPLSLFIDFWRSFLLQLAALAAFVLGFMDWQWRWPASRQTKDANTVTILTNNRGQNMRTSLQPFIQSTNPDIVVFQESAGEAALQLRSAPRGRLSHFRVIGEFSILSAFPIVAAEAIRLDQKLRRDGAYEAPVAARFVIDFRGRHIAVYNIHLPTPREPLVKLRRGAFLYGLLGFGGTEWEQRRLSHEAYWHRRLAQTVELQRRFAQEPFPFVAAGDFNAPDLGRAIVVLSQGLSDAHEERGYGFGYTFPGYTRNFLSALAPWLRIDYILAERDWEVLSCVTESDRASQHRAVAATLRLQ